MMSSQFIDDLLNLIQVGICRFLIPHPRVIHRTFRADLRLVRSARSRFNTSPKDPEAHHIEPQSCDSLRVAVAERIGLTWSNGQCVRRQFVNRIDTMHRDDASETVGDIGAIFRVQRPVDISVVIKR